MAIFELDTLIAIIVIILVALIILTLIIPRISNQVETTECIEKSDDTTNK